MNKMEKLKSVLWELDKTMRFYFWIGLTVFLSVKVVLVMVPHNPTIAGLAGLFALFAGLVISAKILIEPSYRDKQKQKAMEKILHEIMMERNNY